MGGPRERAENSSMRNMMKEKKMGDADGGKFMKACKTGNLVKVELRGNKIK